MAAQDAIIHSVAGNDTRVGITDSSGNTFRHIASAGQMSITKNGSAYGFGAVAAVTTKTADYTLTAADSGTWFNTKGAAGTVIFTLPAVATSTGFHYRFTAAANQILTVTAPAGTMVTYNNAAATSVSTGTVNIGHGFEAICDGSFWYVSGHNYVTANTTVA